MNKDVKANIEIKPSELKSIINDYYRGIYKEQFVSVGIESGRKCVGIYESQVLYTSLKLKRKIKLKGLEVIVEEQIEDEQIKLILNEYLEEHNYEVDELEFNTKCRLVGLYEDEEIYFKGLNVGVKNKEKQKQKVL